MPTGGRAQITQRPWLQQPYCGRHSQSAVQGISASMLAEGEASQPSATRKGEGGDARSVAVIHDRQQAAGFSTVWAA
jgi:hypothetical protein